MLPPTVALDDPTLPNADSLPAFNTWAAEVMRQHLTDALDFLADIHTITRIKTATDKIKVFFEYNCYKWNLDIKTNICTLVHVSVNIGYNT